MKKTPTLLIFSQILIAIVGGLLLEACQKNIDVAPQPYAGGVSIQCLLNPGEAPTLYLNRSVPYFDPKQTNAQLFIRDAQVSIATGDVTYPLTPDSLYNGFRCGYEYFYKGKSLVQKKATYRLNILWQGQTYTASAMTNLPVTPIDSVSYVPSFKDLYGDHEGVVINIRDQNCPDAYYRYTMARSIDSSTYDASGIKSPCLTDQRVRVLEIGRTVFPSRGSGMLTIVAEPTYLHKKGDVGYIRLQTMDKNSFDFYDQIDRQKLALFNPFVEPVFLRPTQFPNAVGVFGAIAVSDSVRFVYPE